MLIKQSSKYIQMNQTADTFIIVLLDPAEPVYHISIAKTLFMARNHTHVSAAL